MPDEPFDPYVFLEVAKDLAAQEYHEGRLRTAVSRAYYAAMLIARAKMRVTARRDVGYKVVGALKASRSLGGLGSKLDALIRMRRAADYELIPENTHLRDWDRNWKTAVALAEDIVAKLT